MAQASNAPEIPLRSPVNAAKPVHCSFCLKPQSELKALVAGPGLVFICDECVAFCNDILAGRAPDMSRFSSLDHQPTERLLSMLGPTEETMEGKATYLQLLVDTLRARAVSWARIGTELGISRQSAWERFS